MIGQPGKIPDSARFSICCLIFLISVHPVTDQESYDKPYSAIRKPAFFLPKNGPGSADPQPDAWAEPNPDN